MKIKYIIKQSSFTLFGFIINSTLNIIYVPILSKFLNPEKLGLYFLFFSFIGYYSLFDLGIVQGIIRNLSISYNKQDCNKFNEILTAALLFFFFISILIIVVVNLNGYFLLKFLNISNNLIFDAKNILFLVSISFALSLIFTLYSSTFQAMLRFDISNILNISSTLVFYILSIIILFKGYDLINIFFIHNIIIFIFILIGIFILKKININYKLNANNFISNLKELINFSFYVFISKISNSLNTNLIPIFISYFHSPVYVPYFIIPLKLMNIVSVIISSLGNTIFPISSVLNEKNNIVEIKKILDFSFKFIIKFLSPFYFAFFILSNLILSIWMGDEFANKSDFVLSLLSLSYFLSSFTVIPSNILLGMGYSKFIGFYSLLLSCISILLNIFFIKYYSFIGSAIANFLISLNSFLFIYLSKRKLLI